MIITKKAIPRRTVLRGMGATLALPLLDGMVPALSALQKTAAKPINRFGVMYVPNGMIMKNWTPAAEGAGFELTPTLAPLAPFRDQLLVLSGLDCVPTPGRPGRRARQGQHAVPDRRLAADERNVARCRHLDGSDPRAAKPGKQTQLASLELAIESGETAGACDVGFACAYTNTISWRSANTPLPTENNPRVVFERLFGDSGSTDPKARPRPHPAGQERARLGDRGGGAASRASLGPGDRRKLTEYLDAIRDVERRIQMAEEQSGRELPLVDHPAGIPDSCEDHVKLMFDLQVLAYQSDLTRVITFMLGREFSGMTYPQIGVPDAHHPISHHQQEPEKVAKVAKINAYHVTQFAYLLEKLQATPDGDGTLLDHVTMMYGAGMGDSNATIRATSRCSSPAAAPASSRAAGTSAIEGHAAREPAPDAARPVRRAAGSHRRQHGTLDDRDAGRNLTMRAPLARRLWRPWRWPRLSPCCSSVRGRRGGRPAAHRGGQERRHRRRVQALLKAARRRECAPGRRRDGAPLGRASRRSADRAAADPRRRASRTWPTTPAPRRCTSPARTAARAMVERAAGRRRRPQRGAPERRDRADDLRARRRREGREGAARAAAPTSTRREPRHDQTALMWAAAQKHPDVVASADRRRAPMCAPARARTRRPSRASRRSAPAAKS